MAFYFCLLVVTTPAGALPDSCNFYRDYNLIYAPQYDLLNSAVNLNSAGKLLYDAWFRALAPKVKNGVLRTGISTAWIFLTRWSALLFPHEFGHWLRARQVGGDFGFERFAFPGIIGWMKLPESAPLESHILALIGGLEVDDLTAELIAQEFYHRQGLYNDEFGLVFGHRLMYPLYALLTLPANPQNPDYWENVGGDPATFVKLIWERNSRPVLMPDSSVNPQLLKLHYGTIILSILINLADINFYHSAGAFFGPELGGRPARFLLGDEQNGWAYSTLFNPSPLGPEVYLFNYFRLKGRFYTTSLRFSFPLYGFGAGIRAPEFFTAGRLMLGFGADVWHQRFYGTGAGLSVELGLRLGHNWQLLLSAGGKTRGYLPGRPVGAGFAGYAGVKYIMP
ncbi:MAG: hypothetical protein ABIK51_03960 [candidate division WOR-3 bacterium]